MGTPFITFLGPSDLNGYDRKKPATEQPQNVPKTFLDAMEVREEVFVKEQKVPLENEFDSDDPRACHWVIYASINTVTDPEVTDNEGNIVRRKQSVTRTTPIGTIRLVPFPHPPHPEPGSSYAADALETGPAVSKTLPNIADRETTYHDGIEAYLKLGRLAVLKEFRGSGIAKMLVSSAMTWCQQNASYFNPSPTALAANLNEVPRWKGLLCVHAQEEVVKVWAKWGFKLDDKMGSWVEEGIRHRGMWNRLNFEA